jgi:hypothetical protein
MGPEIDSLIQSISNRCIWNAGFSCFENLFKVDWLKFLFLCWYWSVNET